MHAGAICGVAVGVADAHDTGGGSAADAIDTVGIARSGCSEHADRIPRRWCGRKMLATTAPPNAYARRQTASSDDTRAVCDLVGIGNARYAGIASGADANHTGRVARAALPIDANRVLRVEWYRL
jgi:hypothetical protein